MSVAAKQQNAFSFKGWLVVSLVKLSGLLPLRVSRALGSLMGVLVARLGTRAWTTTQCNLQMCYPQLADSERDRLARASVRETCRLMLETGAIWTHSPEWLNRKILRVHGKPILDAALQSGKGIIVLAPHLGNWEVLGPYLGQITRTTVLYQPPEIGALDTMIRRAREKAQCRIVPTNRRGVVALLKSLNAGELTGILPDQVPEKKAGSEFAPFFGVPALTMTLVHNLRSSTGCQVIAAVAERVPGGFELHFLNADAGLYSEDQSEALRALNTTVERCIELNPSQYQWEYKRFRKQPDGSNPYKTKSRVDNS